MIAPSDSAIYANVFMVVVLVGTMAAILYWAATVDNNIENNPDK